MNENLREYVYYDALGRRTQADPNTRRYLFERKVNRSSASELGMGALLRESNSNGQCCVENFDVNLVETNSNTFYGRAGVKVTFDAQFGRSNGCDPSCCKFKQKVKAKVFKNGEYRTDANCGDLDSTRYIPDCYGRNCNTSLEFYNDTLGTYYGTDYPGLKNVSTNDTINIRMEFSSYIEDRCSISVPKEIRQAKYWGFHLYGPADNLNHTLFGEISR